MSEHQIGQELYVTELYDGLYVADKSPRKIVGVLKNFRGIFYLFSNGTRAREPLCFESYEDASYQAKQWNTKILNIEKENEK